MMFEHDLVFGSDQMVRVKVVAKTVANDKVAQVTVRGFQLDPKGNAIINGSRCQAIGQFTGTVDAQMVAEGFILGTLDQSLANCIRAGVSFCLNINALPATKAKPKA